MATYLPALAAVVDVVDPWSVTDATEIDAALAAGAERELWLRISRLNAEAIESCQLLAAYLEGQEPDSGTVAEVGYAAGLGLRCFGLRSDLRQAGEPKMALNLQVEGFIVQSGGARPDSLDALVDALRTA